MLADPDEKTALVIVPDYQLSLAIGKEGQNARLAARLTGFKIDIKSETQAKEAGDFEYYQDEEGYDDEPYEDYEEDYGESSEYEDSAEYDREPEADDWEDAADKETDGWEEAPDKEYAEETGREE